MWYILKNLLTRVLITFYYQSEPTSTKTELFFVPTFLTNTNAGSGKMHIVSLVARASTYLERRGRVRRTSSFKLWFAIMAASGTKAKRRPPQGKWQFFSVCSDPRDMSLVTGHVTCHRCLISMRFAHVRLLKMGKVRYNAKFTNGFWIHFPFWFQNNFGLFLKTTKTYSLMSFVKVFLAKHWQCGNFLNNPGVNKHRLLKL